MTIASVSIDGFPNASKESYQEMCRNYRNRLNRATDHHSKLTAAVKEILESPAWEWSEDDFCDWAKRHKEVLGNVEWQ